MELESRSSGDPIDEVDRVRRHVAELREKIRALESQLSFSSESSPSYESER